MVCMPLASCVYLFCFNIPLAFEKFQIQVFICVVEFHTRKKTLTNLHLKIQINYVWNLLCLTLWYSFQNTVKKYILTIYINSIKLTQKLVLQLVVWVNVFNYLQSASKIRCSSGQGGPGVESWHCFLPADNVKDVNC